MEESSTFLFALLVQWAAQAPLLLVYLGGIILTLIYWSRARVTAALTLAAMLLLGGLALVAPVIALNMPYWQRDHYWSVKQIGLVGLTIHVVTNVFQAVAVGLLLAAAFRRRSTLPGNVPPPFPPGNVPPLFPPPLPLP